MDVPGHIGWAITGDCTMEFARYPMEFIQKRISEVNSKVFLSRTLNKPTVFVTSSHGVKEILIDKASSFKMGYKDFGYIHDLYGDLLLFSEDSEAHRLRALLSELLPKHKCSEVSGLVIDIAADHLGTLGSRASVEVYSAFKELATTVALSFFLDLDWRHSHAEIFALKSLATTHWHGLISIPVSIRVSGWSTSYSKATEARDLLLEIIKTKLCSKQKRGRFLEAVAGAAFSNEQEAAHHLLLFISALIPKAVGSLLTSFVVALSGSNNKQSREKAASDERFLDDVLLEVQRIRPPFYGGRRIAKEAVVIDGFRVPEGHAVAFMSYHANRDDSVFDFPSEFQPERWSGRDSHKRHLVWTFGAGSRSCVGFHFVYGILKHVAQYLLQSYDWSIVGDADPIYKALPVSRPKDSLHVAFTALT